MKRSVEDSTALPPVVDRTTFTADLEELHVREKAHTREGDEIAAQRRRLPMVEVDANLTVTGPDGPVTLLDAFDGRKQLLAYYYMWHTGHPATEQCPGCTWCAGQIQEISYLQSRDITFAVFCQGPYAESRAYHDFMGWSMPWYSAVGSLEHLLEGRKIGQMYLISYVRQGDRVYETYWTTMRGVEVMDNNYALMDLMVYGRQEPYEDSPAGWPKQWATEPSRSPKVIDGRPIAQWSRIAAGRSDDLTGGRSATS
ncbi:putative dithiol-disulfide oxidoreductase (DUF899 family) [Kribbella aluminosa]|uniref:Dithiol-disulfide oxidoreductase (DUF899 family) n=1 Tax=Kribbella aluminosa TaxID=416017 RepID=A0ABS4UUR6_9ACTN|nr:DUF899 family protein [Kribbella aluminosa]MBP2355390.1 putative dithiol-disulfide oxidoreductase (DUF899 family) [Kribbella aluminosa]